MAMETVTPEATHQSSDAAKWGRNSQRHLSNTVDVKGSWTTIIPPQIHSTTGNQGLEWSKVEFVYHAKEICGMNGDT